MQTSVMPYVLMLGALVQEGMMATSSMDMVAQLLLLQLLPPQVSTL